ncbi:phosphoribosylformylglycinamidine synthase [Candidatus Gottesmanbacteria bacterium RIFCSPHIGHO2_01_FULL_39_10]|uniref:Phosphoribosylformylglycinamidine synthase subunit PurL n=1 Tax=Candidatus Gottesmanbacteria bacterium RIFCSPHIGHO2_01_FULL_39_10 TaxID=1798375 RepID=A0A1F5ZKV1_9BACT|nr:MAG: phosphoribosylformylglycinamidine synthase [Candidatus Gottesmanbacteria bacterium RIFCSPHIGHO2_01_FULL_39_10]
MNSVRIEVATIVSDTRADVRKKRLLNDGYRNIKNISIKDVYTLNKRFSSQELTKIAAALSNPVTQKADIKIDVVRPKSLIPAEFDWAIEIGFLPGVTDNIAGTTKEIIEDLLKAKFHPNENVYTSQVTFIKGKLSDSQVKKITGNLYNPIIHRAHIKNYIQYKKDGGMDFIVPNVKLGKKLDVDSINLNIPDEELKKIGKQGIENNDGTRRGPLALGPEYMKTIQSYFKKLGRNPTDIELESLAQTWSEHCKHTIFADPIDEIKDGLFKTYIKRATDNIRKKKGSKDFCVSVFKDNSGAIALDQDFLITHKVETHNSPSALDPFGGSITGIVGVNRDTIGFGLGAKPVANYYGFCFADPRVDIPLYKGPNFTQKMLSSRRIMDGVIDGVNAGGNQSGIPTPQGFIYFDERYRGKPLVFVGTVGLIPRKIKGKPSHIKKALPGDYIVMVGGRVGKDGIHGATFSSEALDTGSPMSAVQIGDPITQKKLSDAIIKGARDMLLYHSITDNGAGGLSCSVAEMAKESGGCKVHLEKVPLKYEGLKPWEIWVSESQERMTLAVPKKNWKKFHDLMKRRGVEATVIGEFTNSGRCQVLYDKKEVMDIDMHFLHYGLPQKQLTSSFVLPKNDEPNLKIERNYTNVLLDLLERPSITSFDFISSQYDYVVQGNSALPPLQGRGRVNSDTSAFRPVLSSSKTIVMSQGIYPSYSDIDTYHMAGACIDTGIRNLIAAGVSPDYIALLDNFCWCSSDDPKRLGQLKRALKACYDYATLYETPFISGKDSMFNDFKGYDKDGKPIKISIPPTLLISSIGVVDDVTNLITLDAKISGDLIYILGETYDELGGSEYFRYISEKLKGNFIGNSVPKIDGAKNKKLYQSLYKCIEKGLIASSISITRGGLGIALAKKAIGGMLGLSINLKNLPGKVTRNDFALFSESQGRIIVTIAPENKKEFESLLKGNSFAQIGIVSKNGLFEIKGLDGRSIINTTVDKLLLSYRKTFSGY